MQCSFWWVHGHAAEEGREPETKDGAVPVLRALPNSGSFSMHSKQFLFKKLRGHPSGGGPASGAD